MIAFSGDLLSIWKELSRLASLSVKIPIDSSAIPITHATLKLKSFVRTNYRAFSHRKPKTSTTFEVILSFPDKLICDILSELGGRFQELFFTDFEMILSQRNPLTFIFSKVFLASLSTLGKERCLILYLSLISKLLRCYFKYFYVQKCRFTRPPSIGRDSSSSHFKHDVD